MHQATHGVESAAHTGGRALRWGERGSRFKLAVIGGAVAAAVVVAGAIALTNRNNGSSAQQPPIVTAPTDPAPIETVVESPATTVATAAPAGIPIDWDPPAAGTAVDEAVATAEFTGFWTGDWGNQVFRVGDDGQVVSVYEHDEGIVVGTLESGVINGWWCEVPSRVGPSDAGAVQLRIIDDGSGNLSIDGRWQYGYDAAAAWNENWDITTKGDAPPADLLARLDTAASMCQPPAG